MSPKSLGSEQDLYAVRWQGFDNAQFIEKDFMSKALDGPAAAVRDRLIEGHVRELCKNERETFAMFLVTLLLRNLELLRPMQDKMEFFWRDVHKGIASTIQMNSGIATAMEASKVSEDALARYGRDFAIYGMLEYAHGSEHLRVLNGLEWRVFRMPEDGFDLVIGDRPIKMWGRDGRLERLWMPISPKALFVAGTSEHVENDVAFRAEFREALAIDCIGYQFRQARRFVVARDLGRNNVLLKFAESNLRMPDTS